MKKDMIKTTMLNEFGEFCNLSRMYLFDIKDKLETFKNEVISDLKGYNMPDEDKEKAVLEFSNKIRNISSNVLDKALDAVDNIEIQICEFYHDDKEVDFLKKITLCQSLVTQICITANESQPMREV